MIRRQHVSLILAGCLALFASRAAWAGPPTDQLKAFLDRVTKSLNAHWRATGKTGRTKNVRSS